MLHPPPTINVACLSAISADIPLLCCTSCTAVGVSAAHFHAFTAFRASVTRIPYGQTGRCSYIAVFVDGTILLLDGVEAHILLIAESQTYRQLQQEHNNSISASKAYFQVVPIPPPSPTPPRSAALRTGMKRAIRGRMRSSTPPNRDAHETGKARSRYRDSRRGDSPETSSGHETGGGRPYHHPYPTNLRVDTPVRAGNKTDQPPPASGASRRPLPPAPGGRHQLPPPALNRAQPAAIWALYGWQSATARVFGT